MNDDLAFVRALVDGPYDRALRLVYADWLEERGDVRGEFLRLDVELEGLNYRDPRSDRLRQRLAELRPGINLVWQALVSLHFPEARSRRSGTPDQGTRRCPACDVTFPAATASCPECGWTPEPPEPVLTGPASECPNPICGAPNLPGRRHCVDCQFPVPLPAGSLITDRYRVEQQLALGGFGYVYRATDLRDGKPVVVKELTGLDRLDFACLLPYFRQEAEQLSSLQHPLVARLLEVVEQERAAYLVLEYLSGRSLEDHLDSTGNQPFPFDWVVEVGKQLCELLHCMHTRPEPLLWTDLSTSQLCLLPGTRTVKAFVNLSSTRRVKTTLRWLRERLRGLGPRMVCGMLGDPPERLIGYPEPRSDLFDLAGVLYRLLTGQWPEGSFTALELGRVLSEAPGRIPEAARWLYEALAINLAEGVRDRYYSARELQHDLERRRVTRQRSCPTCGRSNPVRQPHCAGCGTALTDWALHPCRACAAPYRMGSHSCHRCGKPVPG